MTAARGAPDHLIDKSKNPKVPVGTLGFLLLFSVLMNVTIRSRFFSHCLFTAFDSFSDHRTDFTGCYIGPVGCLEITLF